MNETFINAVFAVGLESIGFINDTLTPAKTWTFLIHIQKMSVLADGET